MVSEMIAGDVMTCKTLIKILLVIVLAYQVQVSCAQEIASTYKPKNRTEKLVIERINALPEIKDWLKTKFRYKDARPDMIVNIPGPASKSINPTNNYYSFQVGLRFPDVFRTHYYLFVDPKTMNIYYSDFFDEVSTKSITLQQWRYWRTKRGFYLPHKWINGKLVLIDIRRKHK